MERKQKMLTFIIGFLIGGVFGLTTMILVQAVKMADEDMTKNPPKE